MVLTNDKRLAENVKRLRNQGRGGYGPLENTMLGYNYRMPEILSIIGLNQLKHLDEFLRQRNLVADSYRSLLSKVPWINVQTVRPGNSCSYYAFIARLTPNSPIQRDDLARRLNEKGVGTSVLYHPIHTQPLYLAQSSPTDCSVAVELGKQTIALPMFNGMTRDEFDYVRTQLEAIVSSLQEQTLAV